jgi:hypothetical protein
MPCYHPLKAFRSLGVNPNTGKREVSFSPQKNHSEMILPCGQCIGCRLERSRQWAIRCVHEAQMHDENSFITLTFDNEHLDPKRSLRKDDFQKFMKRLRKKVHPKKVRFFHCGEYGDETSRPHHHACIFGYAFPDKEPWSMSNGMVLYRSKELEKLWPFGNSLIGDVTYESAAYVARYVMKKQTGNGGYFEYGAYCKYPRELKTGIQAPVHYHRTPPYITMSRKPGLGRSWLDKYKSDLYPSDNVVFGTTSKGKPPRYYDAHMEESDPLTFSQVKIKRLQKAMESHLKEDSSLSRLAVRKECRQVKAKKLIRNV